MKSTSTNQPMKFSCWMEGESANEVNLILSTQSIPNYWLLVTLNFQQRHFVLVE